MAGSAAVPNPGHPTNREERQGIFRNYDQLNKMNKEIRKEHYRINDVLEQISRATATSTTIVNL
jgi:hypothetical protein